jgi:peptidyl-tRNA hydrolase, PTH1 family
MQLVVGLGNPGAEYGGTRHNVGFAVVECLARRHGIAVRRRALRSVMGDGMIGAQRVILARPMTYMNLSGEAVGAIVRMYRLPSQHVIVVVDDIALPVGKLRLRLKGSPGGHNGLESVERHLGTQDYPRIRIGVGAARPGDMVGHVLSRFRPDERAVIEEAVERAADAIELALADGFERAMNVYNRDDAAAGTEKG